MCKVYGKLRVYERSKGVTSGARLLSATEVFKTKTRNGCWRSGFKKEKNAGTFQ